MSLDTVIALKRMYEVERAGGGLQLKTRAANVLEQDAEDRRQLFEDVGVLFNARSAIKHIAHM